VSLPVPPLVVRRALACLGLLAGVSGCPLVNGAGRARTLPAGRTEIAVAPEATLLSPKLGDHKGRLPWAQLRVDARRGLTDRVEAGGRVWGLSLGSLGFSVVGAAADVKLQLRRAPGDAENAGIDVAIVPGVAYQQVKIGGTPEHHTMVVLPVLIGWRFARGRELVFGPRLAYERWTGESQYPIDAVFGGASAAFVLPMGKRWLFVPEFGWLYSPVHFNGEVDTASRRGLSVLSLALGFGFRL
jgi:hypothetical protein